MTSTDSTLVVAELRSGPCPFLLALGQVLTLPWWLQSLEVVPVPPYLPDTLQKPSRHLKYTSQTPYMSFPDSLSLSVLVVNWLSGGSGNRFHHTKPSMDHPAIILRLVCVTEEQQDTFQTPYM